MDVARETVPDHVVAVVRRTVRMDELTAFYDSAYGAVARAVAETGGTLSGPALGWYHGMPAETVDVAAGFSVTGPDRGPLRDGVEVVHIPGGEAVVATYVGPYDGLGGAWGEVQRWAAANGVDGRGDFWEEYVTEPSPQGDPTKNITRMVLPLA